MINEFRKRGAYIMDVNKNLFLISILLSVIFVLSLGSNSNLVNAANETNGTLLISSNIPAYIYLDNSYRGTANLNLYIYNVSTGINNLHNLSASANTSGYNTFSITSLYVNPGINNVYVTLTPISNSTSNSTNQTYGTLYVVTNPSGSNIYVDNVYKGISPLTIPNVATGSRAVYATKIGYVPSGTYYTYVYANQVTNVNLTLIINQTNSTTGSVWMWTPGSGSQIYSKKYLDGVYKGYGHVWVQNVLPGVHTATASYPGYFNYTTTINVVAGQMTNVSLPLTKITYNCTDTDQSYYPTINIYKKGTATYYTGFITDICNGNVLTEYYCPNATTQFRGMNATCAYGCNNGACALSGTVEEPKRIPGEVIIQESPERSNNLVAILSFGAAIALFFLMITKKKKNKKTRRTAIKKSSKKRRI